MRELATPPFNRKSRYIGLGPFIAYFDGCCEPANPGGNMGWGIVIHDRNGNRIHEDCGFIPASPQNSCNVAEYLGFSAVLDWCETYLAPGSHITVYGDSALVIKQMSGLWRIRNGLYAELARKCMERNLQFRKLTCHWIPREKNTICDALSKRHVGPTNSTHGSYKRLSRHRDIVMEVLDSEDPPF